MGLQTMADDNSREGRSIAAAPAGEGRAGKGREKGKGYAMGNKRQITHMITEPLLDRTDAAAEKFGEARATVINRYIREGLERDGL